MQYQNLFQNPKVYDLSRKICGLFSFDKNMNIIQTLKTILTIIFVKIMLLNKVNKLNLKNISFFQKNILLMFKGTILSQLIGFGGSIILAKLYGSEAYGVFGVFLSISSVLTILNTLQLENGIITAKNINQSTDLMNLLFVISFFATIILFLTYNSFIYLIDANSSIFLIVNLAIITSLIISFNKIHESFLTYRKKFKPISTSKILTVFFNISLQLIFFLKFKFMGLIYGTIISSSLISFYFIKKNQKYFKASNIVTLKNNILHHKSILKFILPSSIINSLAINLIPILIVSFFSLKESGIFTLSLKIVATPLFLISASISQVYYQKAVKTYQYSKEKLYDLTKKIALTNIGLVLLFLIIINTIGIYLLELILAQSWEGLRIFTYILSFLILARSSFSPISNIIIILNKNKISLFFNLYLLSINLIAIYLGYLNNSLIYTLVFLSIFGSLGYIFLLIHFLKILKSFKIDYEKNKIR